MKKILYHNGILILYLRAFFYNYNNKLTDDIVPRAASDQIELGSGRKEW